MKKKQELLRKQKHLYVKLLIYMLNVMRKFSQNYQNLFKLFGNY